MQQIHYSKSYGEYIEKSMKVLEYSEQELKDKIRKWYNGYSWDTRISVYNPFSLLSFFDKSEFNNYWFETGTPTFLINQMQKA